jgi:hypothetical protein
VAFIGNIKSTSAAYDNAGFVADVDAFLINIVREKISDSAKVPAVLKRGQ